MFIQNILLIVFIFAFQLSTSAQVVFHDDFTNGNKNGWQTGEEEGIVIRTITDNSFRIISLKSGSYPYTVLPVDFDLTQSFEISTAVTYQSAETQAAGLLFGYLDGDNFQSLVVTKNGYYRYGIKEKGVWSDIKSWTKSDAVDTHASASYYNKISVIRQGNSFVLMINDKKVYQTGAIDFFGNGIGFVVNNEQTVKFDFIKVRYLSSSENYLPPQTLVVRDEFSDNRNNWAVNDSYPAIFKVENGKYSLEMQNDEAYQSSQSLTIDYDKDFQINVRMMKVGGDGEGRYGLVFGMKDLENLYFFQVSGDKKYAIGKVANGSYSYKANWTESKKVQKYATAACYNELSIERKGDRLYYYVNEELLYDQVFPTFFGSNFGFAFSGKQKILVDYLEVNYMH